MHSLASIEPFQGIHTGEERGEVNEGGKKPFAIQQIGEREDSAFLDLG